MNDIETKMIIRKSQTQNWLFEKIYKHVAKAIEKESKRRMESEKRRSFKISQKYKRLSKISEHILRII